MATLKLKCNNQLLIWETPPDEIYSGNIKIDKVQFDFDETWKGFTKTAVFAKEGQEPVLMLLDDTDKCYVPPEVAYGVIQIGVFGINGEMRKTSSVKYFNFGKGTLTDGVPSEPTPDIYQQIINLCEETKDIADTSKKASDSATQVAQSVREDADNGKFDYALTSADKEEIADKVRNEYFNDVETALDGIIAHADSLIGGDSV